jgi:hypothetical protein
MEGLMRAFVVMAALALAAGCAPPAETDATAEAPATGCADGSTPLAVTGLCQADAQALLLVDTAARTPELENCTWSIKELSLPAEVLLYPAATCGEATTTLTFAAGARAAEISYETSALGGAEAVGRVVTRLYGTEPDPQGALTAAIAEEVPAMRRVCEIQPAAREGWPADALIIDLNEAARANWPEGEPVVACGPTGIDETKVSYWRIRQGFAWFVDVGSTQPDFDAANMTIVVQDASGAWVAKS